MKKFNEFDFLRETVSKVPDLSCSDAAGEDRSATKKRFAIIFIMFSCPSIEH